MRFDGKSGSNVNYEPNRFGGPVENSNIKEEAYDFEISGMAARYDHREGNDDYTQAGDLFRLLEPDHRDRLIGNIADSMQTVPRDIQVRQIRHFYRADPAYGEGIAQRLSVDLDEIVDVESVGLAPSGMSD